MAVLSSRTAGVIGDFAFSLGLPAPVPARDGSVSFVFARSGTLTFTPSADERQVLLSLARAPARMDESVEARILATAGLDPTVGRFVHTGVAPDGSVMIAVALDDGEIDLPTIETSFQGLSARHDRIG